MTIHGLKRVAFSYLHDVAMAALSFMLALYLRLGSELFIWPRDVVLNGLLIFTLVAAAVFAWMRLHRTIWRYASVGDLGRIVQAVVLTVVLFVACQFVYNRLADFPRSFLVIEIIVLTGLLAGPRFLYRFFKDGELRACWSATPMLGFRCCLSGREMAPISLFAKCLEGGKRRIGSSVSWMIAAAAWGATFAVFRCSAT